MRKRREKGQLADHVSRNLIQLRVKFGKTQDDLATMLGLDRSTINKKEKGKSPIMLLRT